MPTLKGLRAATAALLIGLVPLTPSLAADERQSVEELKDTVINLLQALVEQGVISREKAEQMVKAAQEKAAASAAAAAKADEGAVRVPYVPQIVKDEIAKEVAEQVKPDVVAGVVKEAKSEGWAIPGALADWLKRTRVSGSVTLRGEDVLYARDNVQGAYLNYYAINQAGGVEKAGLNAYEDVNVDRARFRGKARLAVDSDITDSITGGLRIVTGNTSDLVSETQTLDGTAPYAFGLDELYIRLDERNTQRFPWLSVVGGRFLNPYGTPTDLIFHKDLTFTGAAFTGRFGVGDGSPDQSHIFFTGGAQQLQEIQFTGQDKWLVAGQLGTFVRWGDTQNFRLAGAFYDYFNVTGRLDPPTQPGQPLLYAYTAPTFERQGNTYFNIANSSDPTVQLYALASKFRLVNVNAVYTWGVGPYLLGVTLDAVRNFGYNWRQVSFTQDQYWAPRTKGYQGELSFGSPTVLLAGNWRSVIGYRYLQRDAVIDGYTDSDFHWGGTDATGYYFVGDVGVARNVWVRLRYMSSNAIDGPRLGIDTVQFDLNTRF